MSWEKFIAGKNPDDVLSHQEFLRGGIKKRGKQWTKLTQELFDMLDANNFYTFLYYNPADLVSEETVAMPGDLLQPGEDFEFYYVLSEELLLVEYMDTEEEGSSTDSTDSSSSSSDSDMEGPLANAGLEAIAAILARKRIVKENRNNPQDQQNYKRYKQK
jgi:hypothetical protein